MGTMAGPAASAAPQGDTAVLERSDETAGPALPWQTVVWNDPVNLMSYVVYVFSTYFGYARPEAERLMLQVHTTGRAIVSHGVREEMERDVDAMHHYGLWATMEQVGG